MEELMVSWLLDSERERLREGEEDKENELLMCV
jgi:hypothetical protein